MHQPNSVLWQLSSDSFTKKSLQQYLDQNLNQDVLVHLHRHGAIETS